MERPQLISIKKFMALTYPWSLHILPEWLKPKGKELVNLRSLSYHYRHPGESTERAWKAELKRAYNITPEDYYRMFESQKSVCAICKGGSGRRSKLDVDHDHQTGVVRGLLCSRCNIAIGRFEDNPVYLRQAAEYLETCTQKKN